MIEDIRCQVCNVLVDDDDTEKGWPVPRLSDGLFVCPSCFGDAAFCPEGHTLRGDTDSSTCADCAEEREVYYVYYDMIGDLSFSEPPTPREIVRDMIEALQRRLDARGLPIKVEHDQSERKSWKSETRVPEDAWNEALDEIVEMYTKRGHA